MYVEHILCVTNELNKILENHDRYYEVNDINRNERIWLC